MNSSATRGKAFLNMKHLQTILAFGPKTTESQTKNQGIRKVELALPRIWVNRNYLLEIWVGGWGWEQGQGRNRICSRVRSRDGKLRCGICYWTSGSLAARPARALSNIFLKTSFGTTPI